MAEIKKGDRVQLKSGGPIMTVQNLGSYGSVENGALCVWFDQKNNPMEKVFDVETLELYQEPQWNA